MYMYTHTHIQTYTILSLLKKISPFLWKTLVCETQINPKPYKVKHQRWIIYNILFNGIFQLCPIKLPFQWQKWFSNECPGIYMFVNAVVFINHQITNITSQGSVSALRRLFLSVGITWERLMLKDLCWVIAYAGSIHFIQTFCRKASASESDFV